MLCPCPQAHLAALLLVAVCGTSLVDATVPDGDADYASLQYRDETAPAADGTELDKPVREDGLGSLLLKNLRFRDLTRASRQLQPLQWLLQSRRPSTSSATSGRVYGTSLRPGGDDWNRDFTKRHDVSVSQLAKLLNTLKTRNADGNGVKLQSLRFGK